MCGGGGRGVIEFSDAFGPLYARAMGALKSRTAPCLIRHQLVGSVCPHNRTGSL